MSLNSIIFLLLPLFVLSEPITLTDKTWKQMLCGQWMVEFYAPWCPSCQQFKPIWEEFAKAVAPLEIKVAAVDINQYPSLSGRFGISVLPTIYFVRDGVFRQFQGERSINGLKNYINFQEWQKTAPVSSYLAPDSVLMSIVGSIFDISLLVKDAYTTLHDQYGWPAWLIYIILAVAVILVGLVLGFSALMLIDYCLTGFSKDETIDIPDDSRDADDFEDLDDEKLLKPKKNITRENSAHTLVASSTPQRKSTTTVEKTRVAPVTTIQDDDNLMEEPLLVQRENNNQDNSKFASPSRNTDGKKNNGGVRKRSKK